MLVGGNKEDLMKNSSKFQNGKNMKRRIVCSLSEIIVVSGEDEGLWVFLGGSHAEKLFSYFLGHAGGSFRGELTNALSVGHLFEDGVLRALDLHLSGEIGMLQGHLGRDPSGWILLEHLSQEVEGFPVDIGVHLFGEVELA